MINPIHFFFFIFFPVLNFSPPRQSSHETMSPCRTRPAAAGAIPWRPSHAALHIHPAYINLISIFSFFWHVIVVDKPFGRIFKFPQRFAESPSQFRQLGRAEQQQRDDQNEYQTRYSDTTRHCTITSRSRQDILLALKPEPAASDTKVARLCKAMI